MLSDLRDNSAQTSRTVSTVTSRVTSPIPQPPPPERHSRGTQYSQPFYARALRNGLTIGIPLGIGYLANVYGKPIYNTVKDIANYGKRMTINALTAIRDTPYMSAQQQTTTYTPKPMPKPSVAASSASMQIPTPKPTPKSTPKPTHTPIPKPTVDAQHPKTSIQNERSRP